VNGGLFLKTFGAAGVTGLNLCSLFVTVVRAFIVDSHNHVHEPVSGTLTAGAGELLVAFAEEDALATTIEKKTPGRLSSVTTLRVKRVAISHDKESD